MVAQLSLNDDVDFWNLLIDLRDLPTPMTAATNRCFWPVPEHLWQGRKVEVNSAPVCLPLPSHVSHLTYGCKTTDTT
jgi:hypothetical protein